MREINKNVTAMGTAAISLMTLPLYPFYSGCLLKEKK
jgi:hypothetical protein